MFIKTAMADTNLMLIDLDGIKCYGGLRTFSRRFRPFAHLAVLRLISPLDLHN